MRTLNFQIKTIFLWLILAIGSPLLGGINLHFRHITINDGLSLSSVYYIYQDREGFLWFATEDGLNKYDGKNFTIYNHSPGDRNSLSYKWIEKIVEDRYGNMWLGSRHGMTRLNPSSDNMTQFLVEDTDDHWLLNDTIIDFLENEDYILVGTRRGLNRIHTRTLNSEEIELDCENDCHSVNCLHSDKEGRTWIGTCGGLFLLYPGKDKAICAASTLPHGETLNVNSIYSEGDTLWVGSQSSILKYMISDGIKSEFKYPAIQIRLNQPVTNMIRDSRGRFWIQSPNGLYIQNSEVPKLLIDAPGPTPSLAVNPIKPLLEDSNGNIWYGTFGEGLFMINALNNKVYQLQHNPANPESISDNTVNCLLEDRAGGIWIGTFGSGINVFDPASNLIPTLKHNVYDHSSMSSSFVWSVMEDSKGMVWIGTNNTGINIYNPNDHSFRHLQHIEHDPTSLPDVAIREIFQSSKGTVWIGTDGEGLAKYNKANNTFHCFKNDPEDPGTISNNSVRVIYEDSTGILWIGTRNGLNRFNPSTGKFKRYLHDPEESSSISHNFIYSAIYMDRQGFLWVGTYGGGLNRLDPETGRFTHFRFDPEDPNSLSDDIVFSIYEDEKGYFWIGTNSGLNLFNPSTGKFKRYGMENGLPNEVIYGIIPDEQNRLWMTTNKGVSRLDLTTFTFKNFDSRDGLQSNEFNGGAYHKGNSGMIYAGGVYGLNIIDPESILPEENNAELIISRLEIMGKDVRVMEENMSFDSTEMVNELVELVDNYYLPRHVTYLDVVRLNYKQRFFSIEYAALNHHNPEKLEFRYRMQNLEDHWYPAGSRNYVTFANMKPGTYIFEVEAINSDGIATGNPAQLKIIITPPFWFSYWFILLEALIISLIIVFIYRFLLNQRTNRILKDQYAEIKAAHEQLQLSENNLKELNATKDKFFSIISHDLKNPFASVLSISELMATNFDATESDELKYGIKKIYKTNQHIYSLLENLLTWSKTQRGNIVVEPTKFNLSNTLNTNINILKLAADKKDINIITKTQDDLCAYADREMISTVFRNLLNNAVKFTPSGKRITIETYSKNGTVTVSVIDEGIGISAEDQERLFRIDDKFKSEGTDGEKGTGLGLIICKEFVEKNHGSIDIFSRPNEGSKFSFTIPAG